MSFVKYVRGMLSIAVWYVVSDGYEGTETYLLVHCVIGNEWRRGKSSSDAAKDKHLSHVDYPYSSLHRLILTSPILIGLIRSLRCSHTLREISSPATISGLSTKLGKA